MVKRVVLRKTRERLGDALLMAKEEIAGTMQNVLLDVVSSTTEFSPEGYGGQDIIDTGELKRGFRKKITRRAITFTNVARSPQGFNYPKKIRKGYFTSGGRLKKARPFYQRARQRVKPSRIMAKNCRTLGFNVRLTNRDDFNI